jgi:hypothetical protein
VILVYDCLDDTKEKAELLNRQYFSAFTPENTDEELPPLNDNFQSMPESTFPFF